jgi:uncharacterized NAD(P)/FAD-binding protein YdhS
MDSNASGRAFSLPQSYGNDPGMQRIAIIGTGPTGLYTLAALIDGQQSLAITLYEAGDQAGVGMPYDEHANHRAMLANIASIEIPPLTCTYLEWLREQSAGFLAGYGVAKETLHDRQFLPRVLLGHYFRAQFLALVTKATERNHRVTVFEGCRVTDLQAGDNALRLWTNRHAEPAHFDRVVIATGHVWPSTAEGGPGYFPSPWSGLIGTAIPAGAVGVLGTSLSGIDAAMAVAVQHGCFQEQSDAPDSTLRFELNGDSADLCITLMSRSGLLPEADFYCPIPHQPLRIATPESITREIDAGAEGLLDRVFTLMAREIRDADPRWSDGIALEEQNADTFADAYFANRAERNPFRWAQRNLLEVERNKRDRHTVPWRYALLRLHEVVEDIAPHLNEHDRERFNTGLRRVFIDNYAAVPPESIRRVLALRAAGVIDVLAMGQAYQMDIGDHGTVIKTAEGEHRFQVFIDARGQKALDLTDLPFPRLRDQLLAHSDELPPVGDNYTLMVPEIGGHRIALAALPFLMHDRPFVQGIAVCAEIGATIGGSIHRAAQRRRPWLAGYDDEH